MKPVQKGDYVLATGYKDGDPMDAWAIGFLDGSFDGASGIRRHYVVDVCGVRFGPVYARIKRISKERGNWIIENHAAIKHSGRSMWYWVRAPMTTPLTYRVPKKSSGYLRPCLSLDPAVRAAQLRRLLAAAEAALETA